MKSYFKDNDYGHVQAPEGSDAAYEKRKWLEEKKKRKQDDLEKLGLEEKDVSHCDLL